MSDPPATFGPMAVDTHWAGHGEHAMATLERLVRRGLEAAPLGPVTVVTPSPAVAVAARRALARRLGGLVGVGFHSLGALAELIAAPRLADSGIGAGVDRELVVAAVRVTLADSPGALAPIAAHRATWDAIAATVIELDELDDGGRALVRDRGGLPAEMARIHDAVVGHIGTVGSTAVVRLAAEMVTGGDASLAEIGPVVVHLPERASPSELELLAALGGRTQVDVVIGSAGRPDADAEMATQLALLGATPPGPGDVPEPVAPTVVISANDIDDEIRAAVRRLLTEADAGTPLHQMALVHPPGAPYARVVADVLAGTDIPFSGPSTKTLAQTAPGRVLLGLLAVIGSGFARQDVVDLWSTGVVVDPAGRPVPFAAFDELSRRLGVVRGASRWHRGLDTSDERLRRRLDSDGPDGGGRDGNGSARWVSERLADNERLRDSLTTLETLASAAPTSWVDVATWASQVLDSLCGPVVRRSWPEHELDADAAIRTALGRLGGLARVEPDPAGDVIADTVTSVLDTPAPRPSSVGSGLAVTTLDRPPVVPLRAVAVVGLVEGQAPRVASDDVLLGDVLRGEVGLARVDDRHRAQRRGFDAALASADTVRILTHARHDQRSGRTLVPSRWLIDAIETRTGTRPDAESLMAGHRIPGVDTIDSHSAGLVSVAAGAVAALSDGERTLASIVAAGGPDGHPAATGALLARGAELVRSRRSHAFSRFDGNLHGDGVDVTAMGVLSPTSLETYAACPRRWFFTHALGLRTIDRPEEVHRIQPRDKGTLVHAVLERFFDEAITTGGVPAPGDPWSDVARQRLSAIAEDACTELEERGLTGHPRWWEHDRAEIHGVLQEMLHGDEVVRAHQRSVPVAVEFRFGRDDAPPLRIPLGDGRVVALAGSADRVDAGPGVITVWDYKYGSPAPFEALTKDDDAGGDPLAHGTKLQLVAYGMAAAATTDVDTEIPVVRAYYWFLRPDVVNTWIGYEITDELRDRFRGVLTVLADGIAEGRFPARPGAYQWHRSGYEHCNWCDFDAICPQDRDEEWERVRFDPGLGRLARLVDEGSASVLDDGMPA